MSLSSSSEHKHTAALEIALLQTVLCKQMDQVSVTSVTSFLVTSVTNTAILMKIKINQNLPLTFAVKP